MVSGSSPIRMGALTEISGRATHVVRLPTQFWSVGGVTHASISLNPKINQGGKVVCDPIIEGFGCRVGGEAQDLCGQRFERGARRG